jgi:hypothetical protein
VEPLSPGTGLPPTRSGLPREAVNRMDLWCQRGPVGHRSSSGCSEALADLPRLLLALCGPQQSIAHSAWPAQAQLLSLKVSLAQREAGGAFPAVISVRSGFGD